MKKIILGAAFILIIILVKSGDKKAQINQKNSRKMMQPQTEVEVVASEKKADKKQMLLPEEILSYGEYRYFSEPYYYSPYSLSSVFISGQEVGDELSIEQLFLSSPSLPFYLADTNGMDLDGWQQMGCNLFVGCHGTDDVFTWLKRTEGRISADYFNVNKTASYYINSDLPLPGRPLDIITGQALSLGGNDFRSNVPLLIDYLDEGRLGEGIGDIISLFNFKGYVKYFPDYVSDGYNYIGVGDGELAPLPSGSLLYKNGYYQVVIYSNTTSTLIRYNGIINRNINQPLVNLIKGQGSYYQQEEFINFDDLLTATVSSGNYTPVTIAATAENVKVNFFNDDDINLFGNYLGPTSVYSIQEEGETSISNNQTISLEGRHNLKVVAGGEELFYHFVIDRQNPVGKLLVDGTEVANNYILEEEKSITFSYNKAQEDEAKIHMVIKEGNKEPLILPSFINEVSFNNPGIYEIRLIDEAGNHSIYNFKINRQSYQSTQLQPVSFTLRNGSITTPMGMQASDISVTYPQEASQLRCYRNKDLMACPVDGRFNQEGDYIVEADHAGHRYSTFFQIGESELLIYENGERINQVADKEYFTYSANKSSTVYISGEDVKIYLKSKLIAQGSTLLKAPGKYTIKTALQTYNLHHLQAVNASALIINNDKALPLTSSLLNGMMKAQTMLLKLYSGEASVYLNNQLLVRDNRDIVLDEEGQYQIFIDQRLTFEVLISNTKPSFTTYVKEKTIALFEDAPLDQHFGVDKDLNILTADIRCYDEEGRLSNINNRRPGVYVLDYILTDRFQNQTIARTYFYVVSFSLYDNNNRIIVDGGFARQARFASNYQGIVSYDGRRNLGQAQIMINDQPCRLNEGDATFTIAKEYKIKINGNIVFTFTLLANAPEINTIVNNVADNASFFNDSSLRIEIVAIDMQALSVVTLSKDGQVVATNITEVSNYRFDDTTIGNFEVIAIDRVGNEQHRSFAYIGKNHLPILPNNASLSDVMTIENNYQLVDIASLMPEYRDALNNVYQTNNSEITVEYAYYDNSANDFNLSQSSLTTVSSFGQTGSGIYIVYYYVYDAAGNRNALTQVVTYAQIEVYNVNLGGTRVVMPGGYVASGQVLVYIPEAASGIIVVVFDGSDFYYLGTGEYYFDFSIGTLTIGYGGYQYVVNMIDQVMDVYLSNGMTTLLVADNYVSAGNLFIDQIDTYSFSIVYELSTLSFKEKISGPETILYQDIELKNFLKTKTILPANRIYYFNFLINVGEYVSISKSFTYLLSAPSVVTSTNRQNYYLTPDNQQAPLSPQQLLVKVDDAVGNNIDINNTVCLINNVVSDCHTILVADSIVTYRVKDRAGNISEINLNYYYSESFRPQIFYKVPGKTAIRAKEVDNLLVKQARINNVALAPTAIIEKVIIKYRVNEADDYTNQEILLRENYLGSDNVQAQALLIDAGNIAFEEGMYSIEVIDSFKNLIRDEFRVIADENARPFTTQQTLLICLVAFVVIDLLIFAVVYTSKKGKSAK